MTVELGVDYGFSSFVFSAPGIGDVYGVDCFAGDEHAGVRDTYQEVLSRASELDLPNLHIVHGYFSEVAKTWHLPIDILHIDGRHRYEDVQEDFETWLPFVNPSGIVLLHDTAVQSGDFGVHRFFGELKLPKLNFIHSAGLGVVSRDAEVIRTINRERKVWFYGNSAGLFLVRAARRLRRIAENHGPKK